MAKLSLSGKNELSDYLIPRKELEAQLARCVERDAIERMGREMREKSLCAPTWLLRTVVLTRRLAHVRERISHRLSVLLGPNRQQIQLMTNLFNRHLIQLHLRVQAAPLMLQVFKAWAVAAGELNSLADPKWNSDGRSARNVRTAVISLAISASRRIHDVSDPLVRTLRAWKVQARRDKVARRALVSFVSSMSEQESGTFAKHILQRWHGLATSSKVAMRKAGAREKVLTVLASQNRSSNAVLAAAVMRAWHRLATQAKRTERASVEKGVRAVNRYRLRTAVQSWSQIVVGEKRAKAARSAVLRLASATDGTLCAAILGSWRQIARAERAICLAAEAESAKHASVAVAEAQRDRVEQLALFALQSTVFGERLAQKQFRSRTLCRVLSSWRSALRSTLREKDRLNTRYVSMRETQYIRQLEELVQSRSLFTLLLQTRHLFSYAGQSLLA